MFSAIDRSGTSVVSCVTVAIPRSSASVGLAKSTVSPAKVMRPASRTT
jgi:hypothetical protein